MHLSNTLTVFLNPLFDIGRGIAHCLGFGPILRDETPHAFFKQIAVHVIQYSFQRAA